MTGDGIMADGCRTAETNHDSSTDHSRIRQSTWSVPDPRMGRHGVRRVVVDAEEPMSPYMGRVCRGVLLPRMANT